MSDVQELEMERIVSSSLQMKTNQEKFYNDPKLAAIVIVDSFYCLRQ